MALPKGELQVDGHVAERVAAACAGVPAMTAAVTLAPTSSTSATSVVRSRWYQLLGLGVDMMFPFSETLACLRIGKNGPNRRGLSGAPYPAPFKRTVGGRTGRIYGTSN